MSSLPIHWKRIRSAFSLSLIFLLIEFFDELLYAVHAAALPVVRAELSLTYAQIGLLLGLPNVLSIFIEPAIMLLGDTGLRKRLVVGGGLAVFAALLLFANSGTYTVLMIAMILSYPASGAFVSLSQATLVDLRPGREAHSMARWTVSGSIGNLLGPLFLAAALGLTLGWRPAFIALSVFALLLVLLVRGAPFPARQAASHTSSELRTQGIASLLNDLRSNLRQALHNPQLFRWLILLDLSDLLLDVFAGFVALYFTDIVGVSPVQASLILGLLMLTSLLSDLALIPLLERFPGQKLVRASAIAALIVYPAWLLAPWPVAKILLLVAIPFTTMGWYPVLKAEAFASAPGRSGTVEALSSLSSLPLGIFPWFVGWLAGITGLQNALWVLLLGPLALALFVPTSTFREQRLDFEQK